MKFKRVWYLLVVVMIAICFFIFLFLKEAESSPSDLPNKTSIRKMIEDTGEMNINRVFDQRALDEKHIFIPHLSSDNQYGYSLLEWIDNKWEVTYVSTTGEPLIWRIKAGNQSESYFLWNLDSKKKIETLTFYLIRDRHFTSGWSGEWYEPAIQIEEDVSISGKPYGIYKVPDKWGAIWNAAQIKIENQEEDFISYNGEGLYYGVKGYDKKNNYVVPLNSYENGGITSSGAATEDIVIMDEWEGEQW